MLFRSLFPKFEPAQNVSARYVKDWTASALASDGHVLSNLGDATNSWTIAYNLFADKLLQTNRFDQNVSTSHVVYHSADLHIRCRYLTLSQRS